MIRSIALAVATCSKCGAHTAYKIMEDVPVYCPQCGHYEKVEKKEEIKEVDAGSNN